MRERNMNRENKKSAKQTREATWSSNEKKYSPHDTTVRKSTEAIHTQTHTPPTVLFVLVVSYCNASALLTSQSFHVQLFNNLSLFIIRRATTKNRSQPRTKVEQINETPNKPSQNVRQHLHSTQSTYTQYTYIHTHTFNQRFNKIRSTCTTERIIYHFEWTTTKQKWRKRKTNRL